MTLLGTLSLALAKLSSVPFRHRWPSGHVSHRSLISCPASGCVTFPMAGPHSPLYTILPL